MKVFNIAILLTFVSFVSCTKKEEVRLPKSETTSASKPISELIIGSWNLTSIGTVRQVSTSSSSTNSGCGGGGSGSSHEETSWASTSIKENMSFQPSGDFLKNASNDAVCTGKYKLGDGVIFMKTGCSVDEQKQVINSINATTLIIQEDSQTLYKYEK